MACLGPLPHIFIYSRFRGLNIKLIAFMLFLPNCAFCAGFSDWPPVMVSSPGLVCTLLLLWCLWVPSAEGMIGVGVHSVLLKKGFDTVGSAIGKAIFQKGESAKPKELHPKKGAVPVARLFTNRPPPSHQGLKLFDVSPPISPGGVGRHLDSSSLYAHSFLLRQSSILAAHRREPSTLLTSPPRTDLRTPIGGHNAGDDESAESAFDVLVELVNQRLDYAHELAWYKFVALKPVGDAVREEQVLAMTGAEWTRQFMADQIAANRIIQRGFIALWEENSAARPDMVPTDMYSVVRPEMDVLGTKMMGALARVAPFYAREFCTGSALRAAETAHNMDERYAEPDRLKALLTAIGHLCSDEAKLANLVELISVRLDLAQVIAQHRFSSGMPEESPTAEKMWLNRTVSLAREIGVSDVARVRKLLADQLAAARTVEKACVSAWSAMGAAMPELEAPDGAELGHQLERWTAEMLSALFLAQSAPSLPNCEEVVRKAAAHFNADVEQRPGRAAAVREAVASVCAGRELGI